MLASEDIMMNSINYGASSIYSNESQLSKEVTVRTITFPSFEKKQINC